jgi:hypothetical protein
LTGQQALAEFAFLENDVAPGGLYNTFERIEFVRSEKWFTFKAALNLLHQRGGKTIVETGTMRMRDDPAGCSTLIFGAYCAKYGGSLTTVDITPEHMATSKRETAEYASVTTYALEDSVGFLQRFDRPIDLLYLDSFDCSPLGDSTPAQQHQVKEYLAAKHALGPDAIICADDNNFPSGGKTKLLKRVLPTDGWECIADRGQTLWQRQRMF